MDKVHLALEAIGILVMLFGVISKFIPAGKTKDFFESMGTLPVQAVKDALDKPAAK